MNHHRITLEMTDRDAVLALCDGNPGAINAMMAMMVDAPKIDPDSVLGALAPLLELDEQGIYGPRIWMLYKNVCGCQTLHALAVLRAVQLGIISEATLNRAIDNRGAGLDVADVLAKVRTKLPKFGASVPDEAVRT